MTPVEPPQTAVLLTLKLMVFPPTPLLEISVSVAWSVTEPPDTLPRAGDTVRFVSFCPLATPFIVAVAVLVAKLLGAVGV